jgi:hypothetical protein
LQPFNHLSHRKGFTRSGGSQQHLVFETLLDTRDQFFDRFGLIAHGLEGRIEFEVHMEICIRGYEI